MPVSTCKCLKLLIITKKLLKNIKKYKYRDADRRNCQQQQTDIAFFNSFTYLNNFSILNKSYITIQIVQFTKRAKSKKPCSRQFRTNIRSGRSPRPDRLSRASPPKRDQEHLRITERVRKNQTSRPEPQLAQYGNLLFSISRLIDYICNCIGLIYFLIGKLGTSGTVYFCINVITK